MEIESGPSDKTIHSDKVLLKFESLIIRNTSNNWRVRVFKNVHDCFNSIYLNKNLRSARLHVFGETE